MNIWILNHYAGNMYFEQGGRHYNIAKYLKAIGHEPVVFCCNAKHGAEEYFFETDNLWNLKKDELTGVSFVFVKANTYLNNGLKRVRNMFEFYHNVKKAAKQYVKEYGTPDVILASSAHLLTLVAGLQLAKKIQVKCVCEVRDLWPESIVTYYGISKKNLVVQALYQLERYIYIKADKLIFTMEGAYDYIVERGWEKVIPREKVHFVCNGVDLKEFYYNRDNYKVQDEDLNDLQTFKIVYMGALRKANDQIYRVFDVASAMEKDEKYKDVRIFVYGKGELIQELHERSKNLPNVVLKNFVEKKYVPYILSKCNLNILNLEANSVLKYGGSQNKLFEYLASGKPVISGEGSPYSIVSKYGCGISREFKTTEDILNAVDELRSKSKDSEYIQDIAKRYDFSQLAIQLLNILEG